jgi:hypothetical protein
MPVEIFMRQGGWAFIAMNDRAGITSTSNTSLEEMKQTALKRDEEQVQAIVNHLNETMTDPFDIKAHPPCLMNISTGMHAIREVQDSLLSAVNEGEGKNPATKELGKLHFRTDFLIVPSSWNMVTGISPIGCERMLSIVTSSLLLAKTRARLKTISTMRKSVR